MNSYEFLSHQYDALTTDVDYERWADYLEQHFNICCAPVKSVLDLGCGTGTLACIFSQRGYEVIGTDISEEMLSTAYLKAKQLPDNPPLFLLQSMDELDLYGTVNAAVSCLDSINYITEPHVLREVFRRVHLFLEPEGIFIFDINTPHKLKAMDGEIYLDETDDAYCVWRAAFDDERNICTFLVDLFEREGDVWIRSCEDHEEFAYSADELIGYLQDAGFRDIKCYGELSPDPPSENEHRIFISAIK